MNFKLKLNLHQLVKTPDLLKYTHDWANGPPA